MNAIILAAGNYQDVQKKLRELTFKYGIEYVVPFPILLYYNEEHHEKIMSELYEYAAVDNKNWRWSGAKIKTWLLREALLLPLRFLGFKRPPALRKKSTRELWKPYHLLILGTKKDKHGKNGAELR